MDARSTLSPPATGQDLPSQKQDNARSLPGTPASSIPISVVSNSQLLSDGLISLLNNHLAIQLIGTYQVDAEIRSELPKPSGHIVLLDSAVGQEQLLLLIRNWRNRDSMVIVLELSDDKETILACIEAGASGYALKGASVGEIAAIIGSVQQGAAQCSPEMTARLFTRLAQLSAAHTLITDIPLTPRELEILRLIAKGYSNKAIAQELFIEVRTVKHHVHNVLNKLKVEHRWDAARLATKHGWLEYS